MLQDLVCQAHQIGELLRLGIPVREQGADDLAQMVMGRDEADPREVPVMLDGKGTEGGHRGQLHIGGFHGGGKGRVGVQGPDGLEGVLPGDGAGAVGEDAPLLKGLVPFLQAHQVAAVAAVPLPEREAQGRRLHGGAAGEIPQGIAAEDGEDAGLAAGGELGRAVHDAAHHAPGRQGVDGGDLCRLQGGLAAQGGDGIVGHAVADDE